MVDKQRGSEHRGFAAMDAEKQRQIASKGGKAAHQKGTAHEFSSEEARAAGRKGGEARARHAQMLAATRGSDSSSVNAPGRNVVSRDTNTRDEDDDDEITRKIASSGDDDNFAKQAPGRDDGSGMGASGAANDDPNRNV